MSSNSDEQTLTTYYRKDTKEIIRGLDICRC